MPGMIIAFTPAVGYAWPALLPLALLAAAKLGYEFVEDPSRTGLPTLNRLKRKLMNTQIVTLDLQDELAQGAEPINIEVVEEELASDQQLTWTRGDTTLIFRKDERGRFKVSAMGPAKMDPKKLRAEAAEFAREMVKSFAVNRVASELEKIGANVVEESVNEKDEVVLKLRRWV